LNGILNIALSTGQYKADSVSNRTLPLSAKNNATYSLKIPQVFTSRFGSYLIRIGDFVESH